MQETKAQLTEELDGVCREYCLEVWIEGLNVLGAPADSEWRKIKNIYYPKDLREAFEATLEEAAPTLTIPPKPFFCLPRPLKGLARLVTKVARWKWPRVRRLAKVDLARGQRQRQGSRF